MITFASQRAISDLPTVVRDMPAGAISGGALIPGDQCLCSCGMAAAMNNGTVDFAYQATSNGINISQRLAPFEYDFSDPNLDNYRLGLIEGYYSSVLYYPEVGCLPELALVAAPTSDGDWHLKHIYCRSDGTAEIGIAKFDVTYVGVGYRSAVIYGSILGDYKEPDDTPVSLAITQESVIEWRTFEPFYVPG